jgi:hypothetical protein
MISESVCTETDEGVLRQDRIKGYTKEHIEFLQSKMCVTMFGIVARHAYPQTGKVIDSLGTVHLALYEKSAVRVGTKVNIITHVKSSRRTRGGKIRNSGQRGIDNRGRPLS